MVRLMGVGLALAVACTKQTPVQSAVDVVEAPAPAVTEESLVGTWGGSLATPMARLPVAVHITRKDGALDSTVDSPVQGAIGIPTTGSALIDGRFSFEVPSIGGRYEGTVTEGQIDGTWSQGPSSIPLVLTPGAPEVEAPERPQTPKPPFPYTIERVSFPSTDGVTLAGTFTIPEGEGPFTAVVLLTGSGPQDRDETLMEHKPFWVLADHLSRRGVAVLRFDDRGVGESTGDYSAAVLTDFSADAAAALGWLAGRSETAKVGYVGHSEGGYTAPIAHRSQPADFVVLLAGPAAVGGAVLEEQGALIMGAAGATKDEIARNRERTAKIVALLNTDQTSEALAPQILAILTEGDEISGEMALQMTNTYLQPWFRAFVAHDPTEDLKALGVPTLAVFGEKDLQVPPAQSAGLMTAALGKHGKVVVLDGLNHLFQPAETGSLAEYREIETTLDPALLAVITEWITQVAAP